MMPLSIADWTPFGGLSDRLLAFVDSPHFAPVAFAFAFLAGAAHAIGPGHGKSLAAAYLVGSHGKVRDAAWLGGSVAVMHTLSVFVLAVAWTFFDLSGLFDLKQLTSVLELAAGVTVVVVGALMLRRTVRGASVATDNHDGTLTHRHGLGRPHTHVVVPEGQLHDAEQDHAHDHDHPHDHDHDHDQLEHATEAAEHSHVHEHAHDHDQLEHATEAAEHDHDHDHEHGHAHAPAGDEPLSRPTLLTLGAAGGLTPSPSAFLVLVTGLFSGRSGFALALVATFGLGLAAVLFAVGLVALWGRSFALRRVGSAAAIGVFARVAPVLSAAVITLVGAAISVLAVSSFATAA